MKLCFTKVLGDVRAAFLSKSKEPGMSIHLLQRITDVTRRSRWAHFAETTDLHLADLRRQAEEHHRDRKPPRCRAGARAQGVPAGGQDGGTGRAHAAGAGPWPLPEGDEAWL